jgi:hypothetical protein
MLERLLLPEKHAIAILMKDHDAVKELFDRFEKATTAAEKRKIIAEAVTELKIHAVIEEEIFYPAIRKHLGKDLMNEADEEHHVARVLVAEIDTARRGHDDHREAKFTVLAESVRHHIKEEEGEMLPKAKGIDMDFQALGQLLMDRKKELRKSGIPSDAEHAMVAAVNGKGDTPAIAARRTGSVRELQARVVRARRKSRPAQPSSASKRSRRAAKGRRPHK